MEDEEQITLFKYHLEELIKDSMTLKALQNAGVDNWQGMEECDFPTEEEILLRLSRYG